MTNQYDIWSPTTKKKIAFDVTADEALHWLSKLNVEHGREYVRKHVAMMYWPMSEHVGWRWAGQELLDIMDATQLYGMPGDTEMEDAA